MEHSSNTTGEKPQIGTALAALAARVCAASGTELADVLSDVRDGWRDERTPAALRAGWSLLDTELPRGEEW